MWGPFYDEFKNEDMYTSCYYFLFFLRRLLIAIPLNFLYNYPALQVVIVVGSCWIITIYLLIFKPYRTKFNNIFQILNECNISLGYTFTGLLYFKDELDSTTICWIVLSFIYLSYLIHLITSLSSLLKVILKWITNKLAQIIKPNAHISPDDILIEVK
jgi:hypothetical protein